MKNLSKIKLISKFIPRLLPVRSVFISVLMILFVLFFVFVYAYMIPSFCVDTVTRF